MANLLKKMLVKCETGRYELLDLNTSLDIWSIFFGVNLVNR